VTTCTKFRVAGPVRKRYVRKSGDAYRWCEQSAVNPAYDVAQGTCDAEDLPDAVRAACDAYTGVFYACEWPLPQ
jgi:hypothetical protein